MVVENHHSKRAVTKTGNKPGVTKGKQWIRMSKQLELLDTPGILWPKIDDDYAGFCLAMIGSMNDEIINIDEMAEQFIKLMQKRHPELMTEKYGIGQESGFAEALEIIAKQRNALKSGGVADTDKAVKFLIDRTYFSGGAVTGRRKGGGFEENFQIQSLHTHCSSAYRSCKDFCFPEGYS